MMNPWLAIALVLGIFAAQTIALRAFHKFCSPNPELVRKLLHIGMGLVTLFSRGSLHRMGRSFYWLAYSPFFSFCREDSLPWSGSLAESSTESSENPPVRSILLPVGGCSFTSPGAIL